MKFFNKLNDLILRALDPHDAIGVKRVALLICLMYFIASSFGITIIGGILSFRASKGDIAFVNVYSVQTALVLKYNFLIVSFLIGAISIDDFGKNMVSKEQATSPDVTVEDGGNANMIENVEQGGPTETLNAKNVEVVNTETVQKDKVND